MESQNPKFDLEALYALYPRRGEGKKLGMKRLESKVSSQKTYKRIEAAIRNYAQLCAKENRQRCYIKLFSTFMNNWEDYEVIEDSVSGNASMMERIEKGEL